MADTFKRLSNLLKGMSSEWMSRVEAENPSTVVRSAISATEEKYQKAMSQLSRLNVENKRRGEEAGRVEKELVELRAQRSALTEHTGDLTQRLDEAILRLESRLEVLASEAQERNTLAEELEVAAQTLQSQAHSLKREEDILKTRHILATDRVERANTEAGAPSRAYERALNAVREKAEMERRIADEGGQSPHELNRLKAEARLAALKAQRLGQTPAADDAAAPDAMDGDDGSAPGPDLPKREL